MITTMEVLTVKTSDIRVHQVIDECADLSYLGEYTNKHPGYDELKRGSAFDRFPESGRDYREYQYFIPANTVEEHRKGLIALGYSKGDAEELARSYCKQDYKRYEALNRGDWQPIGIYATANVLCGSCGEVSKIQSYGLWGIESDSEETIEETTEEQIKDLKDELTKMGVTIIEDDDPVIVYE